MQALNLKRSASMDGKDKSKAKGGIARAAKLSPNKRKEIAKKAAKARWEKTNIEENIVKSKYQGIIKIGDYEIPCAVLEDGTRILRERSVAKALGKKGGGAHWQRKKEEKGAVLPEYVSAKKLEPFIGEEVKEKLLNPITYETESGTQAQGIPATLLPEICDIWLKARENGALRPLQENTAKKAEILVRGFAQLGIIALVDEATGYQEVRPRDALQEYLNLVVRKELAAWAKKFPDEFYENIYKLKNWPWHEMKKNHYSVVAHYTKDLVYKRIGPGLLEELERKSPQNDKGRRNSKLHQWLTDDIGNPMLAQHLHSIIMFQRLAISNGHGWKRFLRTVDQVLPKKGSTIELAFKDQDD